MVCVAQAREIFNKMYPESEFLPRAPDPEEIILEEDDAAKPAAESEEKESAQEEQ